jgi:glycosyltransferase involved in cell wall biosynthesis
VFYVPWIGSILSSAGLTPPGGAETQILMLSKALAARGLRVAIVAYGEPSELPREVDGVAIVPRPHYRKVRPIGKLVEALAIWRALWRAPGGAIVYRGMSLDIALLAVYARLARRRLVFSVANVGNFDTHRMIPKRRDRLMYDYGVGMADAIVAQTEEQVPLCRTVSKHEPVVIKSLATLAEPQTAPPEAFLWIGRLVWYKNPLAYVELARAVPEAKFWMVGVPAKNEAHRPVADAVRAAVRDVPNLELLAPRPHAEVQELMARAVASVNTAEFEGMPNVLLEAWARGVPALVLEHDPNGVVAEHGLGGFAASSPERLASLAREQWACRDDREELAQRCRNYLTDHHSIDVVATQWIELLSGNRVTALASQPPEARPTSTCVG